MYQVMGSDYIQEKTELLYALISERQLSDLPIISQVPISMWLNSTTLTSETFEDGFFLT